jgi:hypothetical protein
MDLQYPIGRFAWRGENSEEDRKRYLDEIEQAPAHLGAAVAGLSDGQLDTPYRPGGWTVRQVVHHLPDSHLNSYVRFRLALTEEEPTIKPYDESRWAELTDARTGTIDISLALLEGLHRRWMLLLRSLGPADLARRFRHPELGTVSLDRYLALYAWHGRHHVAHVTHCASGWAGSSRNYLLDAESVSIPGHGDPPIELAKLEFKEPMDRSA